MVYAPSPRAGPSGNDCAAYFYSDKKLTAILSRVLIGPGPTSYVKSVTDNTLHAAMRRLCNNSIYNIK